VDQLAFPNHPECDARNLPGRERLLGQLVGSREGSLDRHGGAARRISEAAGDPAASGLRMGRVDQWEQERAVPASSAVRKLEPHPQADTAFGLLTVKPAPMSVST
jgi:hypothetical protein